MKRVAQYSATVKAAGHITGKGTKNKMENTFKPFYKSTVHLQLQNYVWLWTPQLKKHMVE